MVKTCGLLGRKLAHSFSPMIHQAFDMGYRYNLFEIEPNALANFLTQSSFHGLNVTIPYKKDVIPFCTEISPIAKEIGSVNTLLRLPDGGLFGDNTDGQGFLAMLSQSGIVVKDKKVLVLGSGGSSLTVCYMLKQLNAREIVVVSRSGENNYTNLEKHCDSQVLVNTTPVGMYPNTGESPVNLKLFPKLEGVLDLIYNPAKTELIMAAEALGLSFINGFTMLIGQAAAASRVFSDLEKDIDIKKITNILRKQMENIILIGMPGSGKTTIGQLLAKKLGRKCIDIDTEIEKSTNLTIPDIFQAEGEVGFRRRETAILQKYGKASALVISTGGGCVTQEENYFHLHQNGIIIFIERELSTLSREGRPLSLSGNLQDMYSARISQYKRFADATVQNVAQPEAVAEKIAEAFHEIIGD